MISRSLEITLGVALREARRRRHEYLCIEHLLYAICDDEFGREVLEHCGGTIPSLKRKLEKFFEENLEQVPEGRNFVPQQTVAFERLMQRAISHVHYSGKDEVDSGDILAAILGEDDSHAAYFLTAEGLTRLDILNYVSHGISKLDAEEPFEPTSEFEPNEQEELETGGSSERRSQRDPLKAYTINLNEQARAGRIDPLIGREYELRRITQILSRRRKNNPVLVGDPGVGKTAIAEGLARNIFLGNVPDALKDAEILQLDLAAMLAGTRFRGDFEQRLKSVINALQALEKVVLFIDEIHMVVGAGATSDGSVDASNILKPALASGAIRCIGSTTYEEYKNLFEKDRALSRRFQKIEIQEPSVDETILILQGLKKRYEQHHGLRYTGSAIRAAAELSAKHITDRYLPDKAIDVVDETGSAIRLMPGEPRKTVRVTDIERVVADVAKVPIRSVSASDRDRLATLESDLKAVVYGQDDALHALATSIKRSRAGLGQPEKPVGSFLFTGPTGVGKTEAARQLALLQGIHFARYDMSEYMEKHTVSRLIGAPPGYVGFDQGGLLTDEIRRNPHCVLLLDEIEKAHPDLFNILLQVMDHATLTDNNGKKADFRNVILIMTSNAGARDMAAQSIGFGRDVEDTRSKGMKAIERAFSPEFRNRLDAIIAFNPLSPEIMERIVEKFIDEVRGRLTPRKVTLDITDAARSWLAQHGFDIHYGARPLGRLIQTEIMDPLTDELLFGSLEKGGTVLVTVEDDKLALECNSRSED